MIGTDYTRNPCLIYTLGMILMTHPLLFYEFSPIFFGVIMNIV